MNITWEKEDFLDFLAKTQKRDNKQKMLES